MIVARAPASTANLGPGFDAAAAALDLWNTVEVEEGAFAVEVVGEGAGELPLDVTHLSLQAFALLAPADRVPVSVRRTRSRSSVASARARPRSGSGLVAGAAAAGHALSDDELLTLGARLESHLDNLAAVVHGGVTRRRGGAAARRMPGASPSTCPPTLIAVVPACADVDRRVAHVLPGRRSPHADAAETAGAALLLGAALAAGDAELLRHAFRDRLHEPYRSAGAPLLARVQAMLPAGALGVTLSGSGPTVLVWAERGRGAEVADALKAALGGDATSASALRFRERRGGWALVRVLRRAVGGQRRARARDEQLDRVGEMLLRDVVVATLGPELVRLEQHVRVRVAVRRLEAIRRELDQQAERVVEVDRVHEAAVLDAAVRDPALVEPLDHLVERRLRYGEREVVDASRALLVDRGRAARRALRR